MGISFFSESDLPKTQREVSYFPQCGACGLFKTCQSPKMPVTGKGLKKILIVGEFPNSADDNGGEHFLGRSGRFLRESLKSVGIDLDRDCWKTNAFICHPEERLKRKDLNKVITYCRPNLRKTVETLNPVIVILLGELAVQSFIPMVWKEHIGAFSRWVGWNIPLQSKNMWVCPVYSHSWILNKKDQSHSFWFLKYLRNAVEHTKRPWETLPDYESMIEVIRNPARVIRILKKWRRIGGDIAIDFETNCLKPERKGAFIYSASVCLHAKKAISFLWTPEIAVYFKKLIRSKGFNGIASNMKFESRWIRHFLRTRARKWGWDTMLAAHVYDNRKGVCSIKFQAFVLLGDDVWDEGIGMYLEGSEETGLNRIKECNVYKLLKYGAHDSLKESIVANIQRERIQDLFDL